MLKLGANDNHIKNSNKPERIMWSIINENKGKALKISIDESTGTSAGFNNYLFEVTNEIFKKL